MALPPYPKPMLPLYDPMILRNLILPSALLSSCAVMVLAERLHRNLVSEHVDDRYHDDQRDAHRELQERERPGATRPTPLPDGLWHGYAGKRIVAKPISRCRSRSNSA